MKTPDYPTIPDVVGCGEVWDCSHSSATTLRKVGRYYLTAILAVKQLETTPAQICCHTLATPGSADEVCCEEAAGSAGVTALTETPSASHIWSAIS